MGSDIATINSELSRLNREFQDLKRLKDQLIKEKTINNLKERLLEFKFLVTKNSNFAINEEILEELVSQNSDIKVSNFGEHYVAFMDNFAYLAKEDIDVTVLSKIANIQALYEFISSNSIKSGDALTLFQKVLNGYKLSELLEDQRAT